MLQAIQDKDGIFILKDWWDSIRSTAVVVMRTHLGILNVECYCVTHKKGPKTLYKRFYRAEWDCSLMELEKAAPLLSLCAGVWKADYMLGSVLELLLSDDSPTLASFGVSPLHLLVPCFDSFCLPTIPPCPFPCLNSWCCGTFSRLDLL